MLEQCEVVVPRSAQYLLNLKSLHVYRVGPEGPTRNTLLDGCAESQSYVAATVGSKPSVSVPHVFAAEIRTKRAVHKQDYVEGTHSRTPTIL